MEILCPRDVLSLLHTGDEGFNPPKAELGCPLCFFLQENRKYIKKTFSGYDENPSYLHF